MFKVHKLKQIGNVAINKDSSQIFSMLRLIRARLRPSSNLVLCSRLPCGTLQQASLTNSDLGQFENGKIDTSKINVEIMDFEGNDAQSNIAGAARNRAQFLFQKITISKPNNNFLLSQKIEC